MRDHYMSSYYLLILLLSVTVTLIVPPPAVSARIQDLVGGASGTPRRILHQPLFPVNSEPPPTPELPPPPPPSPITPEFPDPDQPFFPEVPNGQTTGGGQVQQPPPAASSTAVQHSNPLATQPTKPAKRVAVAVSVAIVTLGMLSALAFYLYKHRAKHSGETRKLVEGDSERPSDESSVPPVQSNFLYLGTVDPVSHTEKNGSPYRKLSSMKRSDRNKPSPDLHPLPPLAKPPLPTMGSPPPMSSDDDEEEEEEGHERAFFTPQGSSVSYEGSFKSSSSRHRSSNSSLSHGRARGQASTSTSIPHSKRTSPRSRLSFSSPDKAQPDKCVPAPPLPPSSQPMPRVQYSQPTFSYYSPKRPKFSAPPPPPNMERLQAITNTAPPPPPPPPPPPLPPLPTTKKLGELGTNFSSMPSQELRKSELRVSNSKPRSFEEVNEGNISFSERADAEDDADESKPRLKPLHWDKVRATSDRATVWDQLKSSSFQLNEDMMETLFGCNSTSSVPKEATKRSVLPTVEREDRVLDPKKSQNIAILLRALNVTRDEVSDALLDGNPEGLGAELLETLVKMAPTKEEEIKLRDYKGDITKLGSAERFLKTILDIPFAFKRVEAMLYRANFDTEVKYLRKAFQTLEIAAEELKNSRLFLKLLEAVLRTGNRMNVGTNRGEAKAFKLETLLKLVDIKGTDGKTTLLHFVVQEIIKSEGAGSDPNHTNKLNSNAREEDFKKQGLHVVSGLSKELENVKKAAGMDSDVLSSYVSKLEMGLEKVRAVLQYEKPDMPGKFFESMKMFLKEAEDEITRIKAHERKALSVVKEVTEYFHGNTPKELAHPFRIFMIVREFLSILDNVCKEVRRMQDSTVGSSRSFRIAPNASLPVLNRYHTRQDSSSDEDSTSP